MSTAVFIASRRCSPTFAQATHRYLTIVQLADRRAETLAAALTQRYTFMPAAMKRTLT
nr:hypothetical protein [Nocardia aurantiaca]